LHAALVDRPGSCIRRLGGTRAREMQFTRFLRNRAVTAAEMAECAAERTASRVAWRDVVVVQDTSELALGGRRAKTNGYGPVGKGGALRGLLLHAVLAVDAGNGAVLGLVDAPVRNRIGGKVKSRRSRTTAQKESQRWLDGTARAGTVLAAARSITGVSDRESDIYEHFVQCPGNMHLIVRACQNRRIESDDDEPARLLFTHVDSLPEQGRLTVGIPAAPGRAARTGELAVRFSRVELRRPLHGASDLPPTITLTIVDVRETSAADGEKPIHWRLLTTHTVTSLAEAQRIVSLYRMRWVVEEYFPAVMIKLVAAIAVAAVIVMQLVKARDGTTDQSLLETFEPADQAILEAISARLEGKTARQQNPHPKGSLAFAAWVIARLGGRQAAYASPRKSGAREKSAVVAQTSASNRFKA
jgi:hypothetical protein